MMYRYLPPVFGEAYLLISGVNICTHLQQFLHLPSISTFRRAKKLIIQELKFIIIPHYKLPEIV